jgi:hypothetical protein
MAWVFHWLRPSPGSGIADRPPVAFWMIPLAVALLRTLPFLWLRCVTPPEGLAFIGVGFIPKDFLAYLALIRQVGDDGAWLLHNPFTTDPQCPRFILLFHWGLGLISSVTGLAPVWVLELSRIPLTFVFFWALWRFLGPILTHPSDRLWGCVLVGFSGGIEGFFRPFASQLPEAFAQPFMEMTWAMFGWNTLAAFFNPLWIAALIPTLFVLRPILAPNGPQNGRDLVVIGAGFFLTYWIHPYTAIFILAVAFAGPVIELVLGQKMDRWKTGKIALALVLPLLLIALIGRWQAQDAVYRVSASRVFGGQELAVFWYPWTLGILGVLAIRGARLWFHQSRPYRFGLLAWVMAVVFLHTSPVINGYKFAFLLHLPLCIYAAPAVREMTADLRLAAPARKLKAIALLILLFASAVFVPFESLGEVERDNFIPAEYAQIIETLSHKPAGNALVPEELGNILPAFTAHRVWVGHWFMTPNYTRRVQEYEVLTKTPRYFNRLQQLLADQHILYLVVPAERTADLARQLGSHVKQQLPHGRFDLLVLR